MRLVIWGSTLCPDEEGIETLHPSWKHFALARSTLCPDEEGIETRTGYLNSFPAVVLRYAPMKRGLKLSITCLPFSKKNSSTLCPDEEGIETFI